MFVDGQIPTVILTLDMIGMSQASMRFPGPYVSTDPCIPCLSTVHTVFLLSSDPHVALGPGLQKLPQVHDLHLRLP
jgi:hypothetical protein